MCVKGSETRAVCYSNSVVNDRSLGSCLEGSCSGCSCCCMQNGSKKERSGGAKHVAGDTIDV